MPTALHASKGNSAIETAIRQELGLESTRLPDNVRERVETAIQRNQYRATIGEIAAQAGLPLSEAEAALKALAFDSQAELLVSGEGDVVYSFSRDFKSAIRNKSISLQAKPILAKAQETALFLIRVTFGTTLLVSILITFLAITIVMSTGQRDDRDNRGGGMGGGFRMPLDMFFFWGPSSRPSYAYEDPSAMSFPEAIFSFVFGDGDPNEEYDEQRWRALGRYIQARNGVVTAEEMAPYLTPKGGTEESGAGAFDNSESFVLPCLIKFGGEPFVDEDGQLLYRFPSLQKAVLQREVLGRRSAAYGAGDELPQPQYEQPWELTSATAGQLAGTVGLGILNVVGVATLGSLVADPQMRMALFREGYGWILAILPFLNTYAAAFFGIPAFRWIRNTLLNRGIDARNDAREAAALLLRAPGPTLARKLSAARQQGQRRLITRDDIVFSTERETGQQVNEREMDEWDARFGTRGGSAADSKRRK